MRRPHGLALRHVHFALPHSLFFEPRGRPRPLCTLINLANAPSHSLTSLSRPHHVFFLSRCPASEISSRLQDSPGLTIHFIRLINHMLLLAPLTLFQPITSPARIYLPSFAPLLLHSHPPPLLSCANAAGNPQVLLRAKTISTRQQSIVPCRIHNKALLRSLLLMNSRQ